jgi:ATP-dependent Lon protease
MTGELDLIGLVMPVGGIKEKTMAARRSGVKCLVFPAANKRDFDELPAHLKEGLEVHFATSYADVFKVAFEYDAGVVEREAARAKDPAAHPAHGAPATGSGSAAARGW